MIGWLLAIVLFIPVGIIVTIFLGVGYAKGGDEGAEFAGNLFMALIEGGVLLWILVSCIRG